MLKTIVMVGSNVMFAIELHFVAIYYNFVGDLHVIKVPCKSNVCFD